MRNLQNTTGKNYLDYVAVIDPSGNFMVSAWFELDKKDQDFLHKQYLAWKKMGDVEDSDFNCAKVFADAFAGVPTKEALANHGVHIALYDEFLSNHWSKRADKFKLTLNDIVELFKEARSEYPNYEFAGIKDIDGILDAWNSDKENLIHIAVELQDYLSE